MLDIKFLTPPTSLSLISLNGFCGRKAQCFLVRYKGAANEHVLVGREPVWPSGKALGWLSRRTSVRSASALLSLQKLWFMDTVL